MGNKYYGLNRGQNEFDILESSATNATDIELRMDDSKSITKIELLLAVEKLENHLLKTKTLS